MKWDDLDRWNYQLWGWVLLIAACVTTVYGAFSFLSWLIENPRRLLLIPVGLVFCSAYFAGLRWIRTDEIAAGLREDREDFARSNRT